MPNAAEDQVDRPAERNSQTGVASPRELASRTRATWGVVVVLVAAIVLLFSLYNDGSGAITRLLYGSHVSDTFGLLDAPGKFAGCPEYVAIPPGGVLVPIEQNGRLSELGSLMAAAAVGAPDTATMTQEQLHEFELGGPMILWIPGVQRTSEQAPIAFIAFRCTGTSAIVGTGLRGDAFFPWRVDGLIARPIDLSRELMDRVRQAFPSLPRTFRAQGRL